MGQSPGVFLCVGRPNVYPGSTVGSDERATRVVLVDLSEPPAGGAECPGGLPLHGRTDTTSRRPRSANGPGISGLRHTVDVQSDPRIMDGVVETPHRER